MKITTTMKKPLIAILALFSSFASLLSADNRELRIGMPSGPKNYNPLLMRNTASMFFYGFVGRALVSIHPGDGKSYPQLAVEIPSLENGLAAFFEEDGIRKLRANWEIRSDAVWGDGIPITGRDVAFALEVAHADTVAVPSRVFDFIERVEIDPDNPKKFALVFDNPGPSFSKLSRVSVIPAHIERPVFEARKNESEGYDKNTNYVKDPTNPGLYSGPYRVEEIGLGSHVILVRNEKWSGKPPAIEKIILKVIPNPTALEANLISGTIDMIWNGLDFEQALTLEERIEKETLPYTVNFEQSQAFEHIVLQMQTNEILKSLAVRKALVYASDRDLLCENFFAGKIDKAVHRYPSFDPWYTDDPEKVVLYRHSKRTARKLLEEEGWLLGDDGYRYKDGEKLSFQIMTTAQNKERENVQIFLQSEWKQVGIELTIKNQSSRVFFAETIRRSEFPAMALFGRGSGTEIPPLDMHSKSIPSEVNSYSGMNSGGWSNPEVDSLIDEMSVEFDSDKRRKLAHDFLYYYTNEVPAIPLYHRVLNSVTPANLEGYDLDFVWSSFTAEYWNLKD